MAFEIKDIDVKKGADSVKELVSTLNEKALETSENVVDNGLKAAEQWQKVAFKALKTGTVLFGKQQELLFHTLEGVKTQSLKGANRLQKLLNIGLPAAPKMTTRILKKKEVAEVAKVADKAVKKVTKKVANAEAKTKATVAKTTKKLAKTVKSKAVEVAAEASKIADKRLATKKAKTPVKTTSKKDDLKVIDGIGPKMETVLNKAGFTSFTQLAAADAKAVKTILLNESARYKMFEPKEWIKEAKAIVKK